MYLFKLDQFGAIESFILRRGVIDGEPSKDRWPLWDLKIKWMEDALSEHKIGEQCKEVTLTSPIIITQLDSYGGARAKQVAVTMNAKQVKDCFNTSISERGADTIVTTKLSSLKTRLQANSASISWELVLNVGGDEWVYKINNVIPADAAIGAGTNASALKTVKLSCSLQDGGYKPGATIIESTSTTGHTGQITTKNLKPWWSSNAQGYHNATIGDAAPPTARLRLKMKKTVIQAFLVLSISRDASSGDTYDQLIGNIGAGFPQSYFGLGAAVANTPAAISGILAADALCEDQP